MSIRRAFPVLLCLALFSTAAAQQPPAQQRLARAIAEFEADHLATAASTLDSLDRMDPKNPAVNFYLGRLAFRGADYEEAIERFAQAVAGNPDESTYHLWLGRAYGKFLLSASFLKKAMLAGRVRKAFVRAIALDATQLEARIGLVQYYLAAPRMFGGGLKKAREQADAIKKFSPAYYQLAQGLILQKMKKNPAAEQAFRRALAGPETAQMAYYFLEQLYRQQRTPDRAIALYEAALEKYPGHRKPYYRLGYLYQETRQYEKAFALFERLIAKYPAEVDGYLQIGRTSVFSGENLARAEQCLRYYLDHAARLKKEKRAQVHFLLGAILEKSGKASRAHLEYVAALALSPSHKLAKHSLKRWK